jgi:hypothetical protein
MKIRKMLCLWVLWTLASSPHPAFAEPKVLAESVPKWNVGDSWSFRVDKNLDRTVTQGAGILQISMTLNKVENTMNYTVTGIADAEGEQCYVVKLTGTNKVKGIYSTAQITGESAGGTLVQQANIEGMECRRVSDLAFVRAELRSKGTIQLGGALGGMPTPYETHEITVANPPAQLLRFPLIEGDKWRVSSVLSTSASGTSSDSVVTTFNYDCEVRGLQTVALENGDSYECIAISQKGTQTIQSQNSGINIEDVDGVLFFAPEIGNRVRDDAEGEELLNYMKGESPSEEMIEPEHSAEPEAPVIHGI